MDTPKIRRATKGDIPHLVDLILRAKRLNNEFDPLFAVAEDAGDRGRSYIAASVASPGVALLVAAAGTKVVGVMRAELKERLFYEPRKEGVITDFYILPEYRRKALGNEMLEKASGELKKMGAQIIVAELPSQNEIAVRFYTKRGFRSLLQTFAKNPQ